MKLIALPSLIRLVRLELPVIVQVEPCRITFEVLAASVNATPRTTEGSTTTLAPLGFVGSAVVTSSHWPLLLVAVELLSSTSTAPPVTAIEGPLGVTRVTVLSVADEVTPAALDAKRPPAP